MTRRRLSVWAEAEILNRKRSKEFIDLICVLSVQRKEKDLSEVTKPPSPASRLSLHAGQNGIVYQASMETA